MDLTVIWVALASLGGLGLLMVGILVVANLKLSVKPNPLEEKILNALPGANCGGCGYPGCEAYAAAVARGDAPPDACPVGGSSLAEKIGEIMGVEVGGGEPKVAFLLCQGGNDIVAQSADYHGIRTCRAANLLGGGTKACPYGCLGFGDCCEVCPFDAIHMGPEGLPVVDREKCTGCGNCIRACPKNILKLIPVSKQVYLACASHEKGKGVRDVCKKGCHACSICVRMCPYDALKMVDNLPVMDFAKCTDCGICYAKCPVKPSCYVDFTLPRPKAEIEPSKCDGSHACVEACKFKAIEGEKGEIHKVIPEKCVGCGECVKACPTGACIQPVRAKVTAA
ncbi:RnfABCDGE type electron transport complex subunit B [candidate division WOR-3 bacterium]|uniref:Ion-translocating oxidoreductase complex subunit B n=1 Tax=candidate division WOR-3 bacterium TaxID=2052148 RepID=A0A9D5KB22_UNCW3|nr:RnfABCDGE type electron transport complex subunit B [candidate division WOR-3 bacterium]MBD3365603.1 RnfABCDGE type electron transport complex subunit B [candidate division WOR-3 bacterium]